MTVLNQVSPGRLGCSGQADKEKGELFVGFGKHV